MAKKQKKNSGGTPATVALTAAGTPFTLHAYEHDPASPSYGEEAAEALGVSPDRVFKTLVADVDGGGAGAGGPGGADRALEGQAGAGGGATAPGGGPAAAAGPP
ncbi:Cys-tRNA(Pro) deacylase, partial [Streptomyces sp. NPDC059556]